MNKWFWLSILIITTWSCTNNRFRIDETIHVRHQGADIPVYVHGNSENKTFLVVTHGAGSFGLVYRDAAFTEVLEENYVIVYFDQRGQSMFEGQYDKPENQFELMTKDLVALTEVLQYRYGDDISLFLMGHSWGGLLSGNSLLDQTHQSKYKGWINIAGALNLEEISQERKELIIEICGSFKTQSEFNEQWEEVESKTLLLDAEDSETYDLVLEQASEVIKLLGKEEVVTSGITGEKLYRAMIENNPIHWLISDEVTRPIEAALKEGIDLTMEVENIKIPSLFIYGKYDVSVPPRMGQKAFENLGSEDKQIEIFENSIHHPFDSESDKFGDLLVEFIEARR